MPLIVIGKDERILTANAAAEIMLGPNMVSRHFITVLRQPDVLDAVELALHRRKSTSTRFLASEMSGDTVYRVFCAPIEGGDQQGAVVSFEDVSHIEEAEQMRRDFVANVSHELRTPLTALTGFIETLRHSARDDPAARERFLEIMQRESGRMNRLIDDLLVLSRVEAQERVRPTARVDISKILHSVGLTLRPLAAEADMTVVLEGTEAPVPVPGDMDQLSQVFTNLIENAIKYGRGGGTSVTVRLHPPAHAAALRAMAVHVDVIDTGEGIDDIHIARLTERFYRVDSHRSREVGGTGLGLAIVKHIVNRHRGRLKVSSKRGQGSCFSVYLPTG